MKPDGGESWRAPLPPLAHRARMFVAVEVLPLALAALGVWLVGVSWLGVATLVVMYALTMLGIELGLHRLFAHRAFTAPAWLRAVLCALGSMAAEGSPLLWSAIHRVHHRDPDGDDDVHSPVTRGLLWAQCGWYGEVPGIARFRRVLAAGGAIDVDASDGDVQAAKLLRTVEDWRRDRVVLACDVLYPVWIVLGLALPALAGALVDGGHGALTGLVWGGLVRLVVVQKVSFAVNSVGHAIGTRFFATKDASRNNALLAVLTLGSGWHNNHHAFPGSASVWFAPWHVDPTWAVLRALELTGVVTDVRRVDRAVVDARRH